MTAVTPQPGDYLVTRTSGAWYDRLAAWAIRFDTDSPVNHAALAVGPTDDYPEGAIIEARPGGAAYNSIHAYPQAIWSTGRLPERLTPDNDDRRKIVAAATTMIGTPYSWLDIIAIGLAQRRTGRVVDGDEWWVKRISGDGHLICSQLVDEAFHVAGIELLAGRLPGLVAPSDLFHLLLPAPTAT
jgi:cell wall-associated NlpC family hydrolase